MSKAGNIRSYAATPPLGWNSFDCLGSVANERALLDNLEVFAQRLKPAGYEYFVLDIGWYREYQIPEGCEFPTEYAVRERHLDGYGRYLPNPQSFPQGLQPIIDRAHDLGVKFGIHLMRGIPRKAVELNVPVWGTSVHAQDVADVESLCVWNDDNYGVDMTRPGAQAYYDSVVELYAAWGVDFIKADDLVPFPAEIHAFANAIEKCGRPIVFSLSPGNWLRFEDLDVYKRANMVRITRDIWDRREDIDAAFDRWYLFQGMAGDGFWPDLDMIPFGALTVWRPQPESSQTGTGLLYGQGVSRQSHFTAAQKRSFITQRALAASPLMMGGHLPETDEYSFELLTDPDMLACNQNGVMGHRIYKAQSCEIWRTPDRAIDGAGWVGVFNRSQSGQQISVTLSMLGLCSDHSYRMHDIWGDCVLDPITGSLNVTVQEEDVLFLRYDTA